MQKQGLDIETKKETLHKVAPSDSQPQAKSIGIRLISELCDWDDTLSLGKHWWYRVDAQHTMVPWKAWTLTPNFHYKLLYRLEHIFWLKIMSLRAVTALAHRLWDVFKLFRNKMPAEMFSKKERYLCSRSKGLMYSLEIHLYLYQTQR